MQIGVVFAPNVFGGFGNTFGDLLGSFFGETPKSTLTARAIRCEKCGNTFNDIVNSGKIGCADCYTTFYDKLLPSLQRIHGKTRHEGKNPTIIKAEVNESVHELQALENELKTAISEQNFEKAAELRDRINNLKEGK